MAYALIAFPWAEAETDRIRVGSSVCVCVGVFKHHFCHAIRSVLHSNQFGRERNMRGRYAHLFTNQIYALSKWATLLVADTPNQSDVHTDTTVNPIHPQIFDLLSASEYCLVAISHLLASSQPDISQFSVLVSFIHDSPLTFNCVPVRFQLLVTSLLHHQCLTIS